MRKRMNEERMKRNSSTGSPAKKVRKREKKESFLLLPVLVLNGNCVDGGMTRLDDFFSVGEIMFKLVLASLPSRREGG